MNSTDRTELEMWVKGGKKKPLIKRRLPHLNVNLSSIDTGESDTRRGGGGVRVEKKGGGGGRPAKEEKLFGKGSPQGEAGRVWKRRRKKLRLNLLLKGEATR